MGPLVIIVVTALAGPEMLNSLLRFIEAIHSVVPNVVIDRLVLRDEAGNFVFLVVKVTVPESTIERMLRLAIFAGSRTGTLLDWEEIIRSLIDTFLDILAGPPRNRAYHLHLGGATPETGDSSSAARREREQQQMYFDMGWAVANLGCCMQLGGLSRADFALAQRTTTSCYISVAAAALFLSLCVLVSPKAWLPSIRKFMLLVALLLLFLEYWIIKPHLSSI
ncbi:uncharacterized protein LOC116250818 [Nymphaea colorata]|uniref:Uncharacterized protein n=1 Tax=Nymphaea colorata TaxID=210225 RepID=A0A5K1BE62_9MAGN|nr:uncharacterized protein LOC116250818 [Nymphaea colorata]